MKKNDWLIYSIFVFLIAVSFFGDETKTQWVNNAILAFTAIIILWYTRETSKMKQEVAKQNLLLTRPLLILELNSPKVFLKNEGRGPALNGVVEKFKVRFLERDKLKEIMSDYEFDSSFFVPVDKSHELIIKRKDIESGTKGTVPEPDVFFQIGCTVNITLKYEDIEGGEYRTHMEFRSGTSKSISFERL